MTGKVQTKRDQVERKDREKLNYIEWISILKLENVVQLTCFIYFQFPDPLSIQLHSSLYIQVHARRGNIIFMN